MLENHSPPIGADFNPYSGTFIVVSPSNIIIFSAATGNILKVFGNIQDERSNAAVKSF
jgi:hypothetical protein